MDPRIDDTYEQRAGRANGLLTLAVEELEKKSPDRALISQVRNHLANEEHIFQAVVRGYSE